MNKTILAICIGFVSLSAFTTCSIFEPYDEIYYHKVGAEGYVYYQDKPVPDVFINVRNHFKSKGKWTTISPIDEGFRTDATGYFRLRFIRRAKHQDIVSYGIYFYADTLRHEDIAIFPKDLYSSKNNIQLGKLNFKKKY